MDFLLFPELINIIKGFTSKSFHTGEGNVVTLRKWAKDKILIRHLRRQFSPHVMNVTQEQSSPSAFSSQLPS